MVISKILLLPENPKLEPRTLRKSRVREVSLLIVDGGARVHEVSLLIVVGRWKCLLFASKLLVEKLQNSVTDNCNLESSPSSSAGPATDCVETARDSLTGPATDCVETTEDSVT